MSYTERKQLFENENYLSPVFGYPERPVEWFEKNILIDFLKYTENKNSLLDVGCSYGYYTKYFTNHINKVTGIDFASNRIDTAKVLWRDTNINFIQTPIEEFDKKCFEKFDIMFTSMVIQHIPKQNKIDAFKSLFNVATEDCTFIMYDFNWFNEDVTNDFVAPISPLWIKKYISQYWNCESCQEYIRESPGERGMMYRYILKRV